VRADYPLADDARRILLLQTMRELVRNVPKHHDDMHD
jgi:hypothetical protein